MGTNIELKNSDVATCLCLTRKMKDCFPLSEKYLNDKKIYGNDDFVDWYEIIFPDITITPAALLCCLKTDSLHINNALHISVFEVATPIQHYGRGTQIMNKIIEIAENNNYDYITLRANDISLLHFYKNFGFKRFNSNDKNDLLLAKKLN